ncbi:MAG: Fic family protein [Candidatus Pacebacteria bacterium]|nr:Fic family protein [Candidatus Paceibacterota bacterium]
MKKVIICKKEKQTEGYVASVPLKFPNNELFDVPQNILLKAVEAERLIGKLDGITLTLPAINFFLRMFSYKDATSSSQIEGTQATMADALEMSAEIDDDQTDAKDILFYIKAMEYGIERLKEFPVSLRFFREIHKKLMDGARATHFSDPGEFRKSQNWIGGTNITNASFIPVPYKKMDKNLDDLEKFIYDDTSTLPLVAIAYAHAQFETIHPFLDGNGRVGRLLITFLLMKKGILEKPVLFLSSYFRKHKKIYYTKLGGYHDGEVFEWVDFFLDGVIETAEEAIAITDNIRKIRDEDMEKIQVLAKRESDSGVKFLQYLFENPIVTTKSVMRATGFTRAGAQKVIDRFIKLNILKAEQKEINYDIKYTYDRYFRAFMN